MRDPRDSDAPREAPAASLAACLDARPADGERRFRAVAVVPPGHPVYDGHFPAAAILPGAAELRLVELAATRAIGRPLRLAGVRSAKFSRPLFPGTEISIDGDWRDEGGGRVAVAADLTCGGERAATVKLALVPATKP